MGVEYSAGRPEGTENIFFAWAGQLVEYFHVNNSTATALEPIRFSNSCLEVYQQIGSLSLSAGMTRVIVWGGCLGY